MFPGLDALASDPRKLWVREAVQQPVSAPRSYPRIKEMRPLVEVRPL